MRQTLILSRGINIHQHIGGILIFYPSVLIVCYDNSLSLWASSFPTRASLVVKTMLQRILATSHHAWAHLSSKKGSPVHVIAIYGWGSYSLKEHHNICQEEKPIKETP